MKPSKSKTVKILIGILCVLLLAGVVTLALYLDSYPDNAAALDYYQKLIAERGTYYQLYTGAFELE